MSAIGRMTREKKLPMTKPYAIVLSDGDYATVHTFDQPELWLWLHRAEKFPRWTSRITSEMPGVAPGVDPAVFVTVGSPDNDKAQHIVGEEPDGSLHPWVTRAPEINDMDEYDEVVGKLREELGADHVYEGLYY